MQLPNLTKNIWPKCAFIHVYGESKVESRPIRPIRQKNMAMTDKIMYNSFEIQYYIEKILAVDLVALTYISKD